MQEDTSVSKGVFPKVKAKFGSKARQNKAPKKLSAKDCPWYRSFKETWISLEKAATQLNIDTFRQILNDIHNFVVKIKEYPLLKEEIPTGILLTGVNLPDHNILLHELKVGLETVTPYIAPIWSRDCQTLKNLTENLVYKIINRNAEVDCLPEVKKTYCTFYSLERWYVKNVGDSGTPIVIIVPDFESFPPKVLQDFILILESYLVTIKFVLIFGVATTLHVVHRSLSYDATSKLQIRVFRIQEQVQSLSNMLDNLILSPTIPFKLTGKAFQLLVNVFIFYDFSTDNFLKSYKVCMWRHFSEQNEKIICCNEDDIETQVNYLTNVDLKYLKNLVSMKKYLQETQNTDISNKDLKKLLINLLEGFHSYMDDFLIVLKCLHEFTKNLPGHPFGKNFREIYAEAVQGAASICKTSTYEESMQLISFLSKGELLKHLLNMIHILENQPFISDSLKRVIEDLRWYHENIEDASLEIISEPEDEEVQPLPVKNMRRSDWREKLKQDSKIQRQSPYKEIQKQFIVHLNKKIFEEFLKSPHQVPLHEVFCFNDAESIKNCIRGSAKAAIHNALVFPQNYFGNDSHNSENEIVSTELDLNIIFKLHLEQRKMINLYDLLQSFVVVIDPNNDRSDDDVDPAIQARFIQAVATLEFLGFIKATRKKTDHVKRLTV